MALSGYPLLVLCLAAGQFAVGDAQAEVQSSGTPASEFERFFQLRAATPAYPFTALLEQLAEGDAQFTPKEGFEPPTHGQYLQIPDGRSLQKKKADFKDPREVASFTSFSPRSGLSSVLGGLDERSKHLSFSVGPPPLFIGHAIQAGQLEIISWNSSLRRYDFLIVEDYGPGKTPRIIKPDREVCLACHQAGGPIFSRASWSETQQFNSAIDSGIVAANGEDKKAVEGPKSFSRTVFSFDGRVRAANRFRQAAQACATVCGEELECRRLLLKAGLLRQSILGESLGSLWLSARFHKEALHRALRSCWPKDGFAYPSSVLPDRIPSTGSKPAMTAHIRVQSKESLLENARFLSSGNGFELHPVEALIRHGGSFDYDETLAQVGAVEDDGFELVFVPSDSDPSTDPALPRPKVSGVGARDAAAFIVENGAACLGLDISDYLALSRFDPSEIDRVLSGAQVDSLLRSWPPSRERIMETVLAALQGGKSDASLACLSAAAFSSATTPIEPPVLAPLGVAREAATRAATQDTPRALAHFERFCAKCHSGPDAIEDFGIISQEDLAATVRDGKFPILDKLRSGDMPPGQERWAPERKEEWERARQEMLKDLDEGFGKKKKSHK